MTNPIQPMISGLPAELPQHMALPDDRMIMVFKGNTMAEALRQAELACIENVDAWSGRACLCGEWTVMYEVRA